MINSEIFFAEYTKLCKYFGKDIAPEHLPAIKEVLSEALDTSEFLTACRNAISDSPFFPTPRWLIDSVLGTLEERAIIQFQNLDRLSVVGRQALEATGGVYVVRNSERPEFVRKDFISNYLAFAKATEPIEPCERFPNGMSVADQLRMPKEPLLALNPSQKQEPPIAPNRPVTLADKVGMLRCRCNFEKQRASAWAEAKKYGFTVNMSPLCAENQRITLSPGQNPNEILDESIEDFQASVRSLTSSLAGKQFQTLGF